MLSFYQLWLDDLFPKAKFLDALAMVEKAGHKTSMHRQRMEWISEGKPKATLEEDDDYQERAASPAREPSRIAPIFEKRTTDTTGRPSTPTADNIFGDEDIYNATPRARLAERNDGGEPDDELDSLMAQAEAEAQEIRQSNGAVGASNPFTSIFGGGRMAQATQAAGEPDQDELDDLMAEAEAEPPVQKTNGKGTQGTGAVGSIFGDGKPKEPSKPVDEDDPDDLDALMAETEANGHPPKPAVPATSTQKEPGPAATEDFGDDEEAMAEMDGLWDESAR